MNKWGILAIHGQDLNVQVIDFVMHILVHACWDVIGRFGLGYNMLTITTSKCTFKDIDFKIQETKFDRL